VHTNREISARNALRLGAQRSQARASSDDRTDTASEDVTHALQRTVSLMSSELDKSGYSAQLLEESSATIATVSESYISFRDMLRNSASIIRSMERAEMIDFGILAGAILFFVGCVLYVLHVRVVSRSVWVLNILWNMLPGSAGPTLTSAVGMFASSTAPQHPMNIAGYATPYWGTPLEQSKHARRTDKYTAHVTKDSAKVAEKTTTKRAAEKATTSAAIQKVAAEKTAENTDGAETAAKKATKEKATAENAEVVAAAKKAADEKAAAEKAAAEIAEAEAAAKMAQEMTAAKEAEAETAAKKAAAEKAAAGKAQAEVAEKEATGEDGVSMMKEAEVNAAPEKEAMDKAETDKAIALKAATETAIAQKAAEETATGKVTAESVVDKGAIENAASKETTRNAAADITAAESAAEDTTKTTVLNERKTNGDTSVPSSSKKPNEAQVPEAVHSSEANSDTMPNVRIDTSHHSSTSKISNWTHDEL
jgi:hypothetical protein